MHFPQLRRIRILIRRQHLPTLHLPVLIHLLHPDPDRQPLDVRRIVPNLDALVLPVHGQVRVEVRHRVDAALVRHGKRRAAGVGAVAAPQQRRVEGVAGRDAEHGFGEAEGFAHEGRVVAAQAAEEAAQVGALGRDVAVREGFGEEGAQQRVLFRAGRGGDVGHGAFELEGAALVDEGLVGAGEVADAGVEDGAEGGELALEGGEEAGGVAAHVADEDAVGGSIRGGDDAAGGGEGEGEGLFDEDAFAGGEGGGGVGFVEFVRGEDEDDVDGGVRDDGCGVGGVRWDVEFGGAVGGNGGGDVADGGDGVEVGEEGEDGEVDDLGVWC